MIESCSIMVGPANDAFAMIYARMPFALPQDRAERWLDRKLTDADQAMELLQPNAEDAVVFHRVSQCVSKARNQGADLIEPVRPAVDTPGQRSDHALRA